MSKKIALWVCLLFIVFCFGCKSTEKIKPNEDLEVVVDSSVIFETSEEHYSENIVFIDVKLNERETTLPVTVLQNHSFLTEENVGESVIVIGLLQKKDNNWVLVENPTRRSRVTFFLEVSKSFEKLFLDNDGKKVQITGVLTKVRNSWTKEMVVVALENTK